MRSVRTATPSSSTSAASVTSTTTDDGGIRCAARAPSTTRWNPGTRSWSGLTLQLFRIPAPAHERARKVQVATA